MTSFVMYAIGLQTVTRCSECAQDQVGKKVALSADVLTDAIEQIQQAVLEAYPEGLPDDNPFKLALHYVEGPLVSSCILQAGRELRFIEESCRCLSLIMPQELLALVTAGEYCAGRQPDYASV